MTNIDELIETANRLCENLEKAAAEEKRFCVDICLKFEQMSWEMLRTANDLNEIKHFIS